MCFFIVCSLCFINCNHENNDWKNIQITQTNFLSIKSTKDKYMVINLAFFKHPTKEKFGVAVSLLSLESFNKDSKIPNIGLPLSVKDIDTTNNDIYVANCPILRKQLINFNLESVKVTGESMWDCKAEVEYSMIKTMIGQFPIKKGEQLVLPFIPITYTNLYEIDNSSFSKLKEQKIKSIEVNIKTHNNTKEVITYNITQEIDTRTYTQNLNQAILKQ